MIIPLTDQAINLGYNNVNSFLSLKTLSLISLYYIIKVSIGLLLHAIVYTIPNRYGG